MISSFDFEGLDDHAFGFFDKKERQRRRGALYGMIFMSRQISIGKSVGFAGGKRDMEFLV